jgi:sentrin-specific protease 1
VILLAVNYNNVHWSAAAINFRRKRLESYDSLGVPRPQVLQMLRKYIDFESLDKRRAAFDWTDWQDYDDYEASTLRALALWLLF